MVFLFFPFAWYFLFYAAFGFSVYLLCTLLYSLAFDLTIKKKGKGFEPYAMTDHWSGDVALAKSPYNKFFILFLIS